MSDKHAIPLGRLRRWRRRILRAASVGLLVLIAAGCWLAARAESARRQSEAVEAIIKCGCQVYFERPGKIRWKLPDGGEGFIECSDIGCPWDWESCLSPVQFAINTAAEDKTTAGSPSLLEMPANPTIVPPPRTWSEVLLGEHLGRRVISVEAPTERITEIMPHLARLPYLKTVHVLQYDKGKDTEATAAVKQIKESCPGVDAVAVTFDFDIPPDAKETAVAKYPNWQIVIGPYVLLQDGDWLGMLGILAWIL
jgi:hypothetical protein